MHLRKLIYQKIAALNKAVLPSFWRRDPTTFTRLHKGLLAWRYYVTCRAL
jgi:hypothetical protein